MSFVYIEQRRCLILYEMDKRKTNKYAEERVHTQSLNDIFR